MDRHQHTSTQSPYKCLLRSFQYKILNSVLYLNKKLHNFDISQTQLYSF